MATTGRPLDESTATLVSPDDHIHAKDLLSTPSKASTGVSSGTVSTEEPSTPEPPAAEFTAPVSVKCGWPNAVEGEAGHSPVPDVKTLTTEGPEGQPPWGIKNLAAARPKTQAAPADANSGWPHLDKEHSGTKDANSGWPQEGTHEQHTQASPADANSGWPHLDKEQPETKDANSGWPKTDKGHPAAKDANSGWPKLDQEHPAAKDANSGWPHIAGPKARVTEGPEGQPPWGSQGLDGARKAKIADGASDSVAKRGDPVSPGDPSKPDGPKKTSDHSDSDAASKDESGAVSVQCGWPNGTGKPPPALPGRSDPGSFGPRGQPPWGTQKVATASPEGQPPWGIKNLAGANASQATESPEGQPPWGIKNVAAAHPDTPADA